MNSASDVTPLKALNILLITRDLLKQRLAKNKEIFIARRFGVDMTPLSRVEQSFNKALFIALLIRFCLKKGNILRQFSMRWRRKPQLSFVKPKPKQFLWPTTTDASSAMSQSEYEAITRNRRKARENARLQVAIGFGFASHWLDKSHEFCWPITERSDAKPKQTQFTFNTQLKTVLYYIMIICPRRPPSKNVKIE